MKQDGRADGPLGDVTPLPTYSMSRHAVSVSVRPSLGLACMNNMKNRGLLFQDSYLLSCSHLTSSSFHFPDTGDTLSPLRPLLKRSPLLFPSGLFVFPCHFSAFPPLVHSDPDAKDPYRRITSIVAWLTNCITQQVLPAKISVARASPVGNKTKWKCNCRA